MTCVLPVFFGMMYDAIWLLYPLWLWH